VNFGLPLRGLGFFAFIAIISEHSSCTPLHPPQQMQISPRSRPSCRGRAPCRPEAADLCKPEKSYCFHYDCGVFLRRAGTLKIGPLKAAAGGPKFSSHLKPDAAQTAFASHDQTTRKPDISVRSRPLRPLSRNRARHLDLASRRWPTREIQASSPAFGNGRQQGICTLLGWLNLACPSIGETSSCVLGGSVLEVSTVVCLGHTPRNCRTFYYHPTRTGEFPWLLVIN